MRIRPILATVVSLLAVGLIWTCRESFVSNKEHSNYGRHLKNIDEVKTAAWALDQYKSKHGHYPELESWSRLIAFDSLLVQEKLLSPNLSETDCWGHPFTATVSKSTYRVGYAGLPQRGSKYAQFQLQVQ